VRIRGRDVRGTAVALTDPEDLREGILAYARRSPRAARSLGLGDEDPAAIAAAVRDDVVVRVHTTAPTGGR
jgi:hypothetical protein